MPTAPAAAAATAALLDAVATVRERPDATRLAHDAIRRAHAAVAAAAAAGPLFVSLPADAGPRTPAFPALATAGVTGLAVLAGMAMAETERLVRRLAAAAGATDGEAAAQRLFAADLPHVRPRGLAAATPAGDADADPWLLPTPAPASAALQAIVARDLGERLPRRVAALLLADAADDPTHAPACGEALAPLLAAMADDHDHGGVAWLLDAVAAQPELAATAHAALVAACERRYDDARFDAAFERADRAELLALATVALQLGGAAAERFAAAARKAGGDLARFLADALPGDARD